LQRKRSTEHPRIPRIDEFDTGVNKVPRHSQRRVDHLVDIAA
jgi:hypothetical protein